MRLSFLPALATLAFAHRGMGRNSDNWWGGAPDCAQSCLSSIYNSDASSTAWPSPGTFCTTDAAAPLSTCLASGCTSTATAFTKFSSLSSSICSVYSSCLTASGSVFTVTYSGPTGTGRHASEHDHWGTYTGTGGVATVTGCANGYFYGGGGGYGWGGHGGMPWGDGSSSDDCFWGWGSGWSNLTTITTTYAVTSTISGSQTASTVVQTYAQAVSDGQTQTSIVGAEATSTGSGSTSTATPTGSNSGANEVGVKVMGAALAAVVAVAGLL